MIIQEMDNYSKTVLKNPRLKNVRPNSMNNYGLINYAIGLSYIMTDLQQN